MNLPKNFCAKPGESNHKYYLNLCYDFKKKIENTRDPSDLEEEMQTLINASRDLDWRESKHTVYKKSESEKIFSHFIKELARYTTNLREGHLPASQDLIDSLDELILLLESRRID